MLLKIACPQCGHIGLVDARNPAARAAVLALRRQSPRRGRTARIANRVAVLEWLLGASGAPRVTERKL